MHNEDNNLTGRFWIDDFKIDPDGLLLCGPSGEIALEPKVMQVLVTLASHAGEVVSRDVLMDKVWAVEYGSDESLTRAISVLRKSFGDAHGRRSVIETIPRMGYKLIGTVSKDGPVQETETTPSMAPHISASTPKPAFPRQSLMMVAAAVILPFVGYIVLQNRNAPTLETATDSVVVENKTFIKNRVFVAPFETYSENTSLDVFTSSLVPQITTVMAANGVSTTMDNKTDNAWQEFDLQGSVDDQTEGLRVTVRFVDRRTQLIVWSHVFQQASDQLEGFDVQIATRSASVVRCILQLRADENDSDAEVLQLYARYCDEIQNGTHGLNTMLFVEPIYTADPDNPNVISLYADTLVRNSNSGFGMSDNKIDANRDKAKALIDMVIADDPNAPYANYLLAQTMTQLNNWAAVEQKYLKATAQNRMPFEVYADYAGLLRQVGRLQDATLIYEDLAAANPMNLWIHSRLAWMYAVAGSVTEMEREFALAEQINPDHGELKQRRLDYDLYLGDPKAALDRMRAMPDLPTPYLRCYDAFAQARMAGQSDADAVIAICGINEPSAWIVRARTIFGDLDNAYVQVAQFDWAENSTSTVILFYPYMRPFREDARFWPFMEELGLVRYWRETGKWPDFCGTDDLVVECETALARKTSVTKKSEADQ